MKKMLIVLAAVLGLVVAPWAAGCGSGTEATSTGTSEPITIGAPLPLTGFYAGDGVFSKQGIEYAVSELNAAGGVKGRQIKVEYFDTKDFAPEQLLQAADTLVAQKKVDAVIGGWCGAGADVQAFGKYPVPFFEVDGSQTSVDAIAKGGTTNVFQMIDVETASAQDLWKFTESLDNQFPNQKIVTIGADDEFGRRMTAAYGDAAKAAGWEVVDAQIVPYGTSEWGPLLTKIRTEKPAVVYVEVPSPPDLVTFLRQFKQDPSPSLLIFGYGLQMQDFLKTAGSDANGVLGLTPGLGLPVPPATEEAKQWSDGYEKMFGNPVAGSAVNTYAATKMWAAAVEATGDPTDYTAVNEYLAKNTFENIVPGWPSLSFDDRYVIPINVTGQANGQLQGANLTTLFYMDKAFVNWEGTTPTFQVPSWIK